MTALCDLARLIRSKNAGPFQLTFDVMFDEQAVYQRVKDSACSLPKGSLPCSSNRRPTSTSISASMHVR